MSRVFVSNIPESFSTSDLQLLFSQANIPYSGGEFKIMKSKRHIQDGQSTGRFAVLSFDTDVIANTAMDAINVMVVSVNAKEGQKKEIQIRATPFIPNFRQYLENPKSNLVIYNIPAELNQSDLKELFQEFGKVLSTQVKKPVQQANVPAVPNAKPATGLGYVLFEHVDEAEKALESANGKFLGPHQLFIQKYKSLKQRMEENSDVLIRSLPQKWDEQDVRKFVSEKLNMPVEEIFAPNSQLSLAADKRPEALNSMGQQAIFTCKSKEIAEQLVKVANGQTIKFEDEGVKEEVKILVKLTRGMIAYMRTEQSAENKKKFADSGRNIQVFQISKDVSEKEVSEFFSQYGEIEQISAPTRRAEDISDSIFHYNILFKNTEAAEKAIENAVNDEKKLQSRLVPTGTSDIRVQKYTEHHDVKSNKQHRSKRDTIQE